MRLIIVDDYDALSEWAAKYIRKKITDFNPGPEKYFVLGLPTGGTPLGTYKRLVEYYKNGEISFKYVKTFNMDEYVVFAFCSYTNAYGVGIPDDHPESYHFFMWENFFKHIDIDPVNVHILNGNALDLDKECENYEKEIEKAGGIELFLAGIGPDGHIAFNEPGSSLSSKTRLKTLAMETIVANARFFENDITKVPKTALTVGIATIMKAREVVVLISGVAKAYALHQAIEEGVNHMWTISAFQMHPRLLIICDDDSTLELKVKTVKYFKGLMNVHDKLIQ